LFRARKFCVRNISPAGPHRQARPHVGQATCSAPSRRPPGFLPASFLASAAFFASVLPAFDAAAQEPEAPRQLRLQPAEEAPPPLRPEGERAHAEQRPFAYVLDPTTPSKGDLGFEYGVGLGTGVAADRPLPAALIAPSSAGELSGINQSLTAGYGVTARFAPFVTARLSPSGDQTRMGGAAGARYQLTEPSSDFRLTLAGALLREGSGGLGSYARLAASYDLGRLRLAGNLHAEKVFRAGRDPIDVLVMAGASYRTLDVMRVGVEFVGQDLEELGEGGPQAEGGARYYTGPTLALDLGGGRVQIVGGPAFDLAQRSLAPVGRAAMLVTF
jgi:hypothetical protein